MSKSDIKAKFCFMDFYHQLAIVLICSDGKKRAWNIHLPQEIVKELLTLKNKSAQYKLPGETSDKRR